MCVGLHHTSAAMPAHRLPPTSRREGPPICRPGSCRCLGWPGIGQLEGRGCRLISAGSACSSTGRTEKAAVGIDREPRARVPVRPRRHRCRGTARSVQGAVNWREPRRGYLARPMSERGQAAFTVRCLSGRRLKKVRWLQAGRPPGGLSSLPRSASKNHARVSRVWVRQVCA